MKKYTALEMEILMLDTLDVLRTSGYGMDFEDDELPVVPFYP